MDVVERLRTHMDSEIARAPFADLGDVMERGQTLRNRRRFLAVAIPATAIVAIVVAAVGALRADDPAADVDSMVAGQAQLSINERSLDWTTQPATLGWHNIRTGSEGVSYVLSTAPGATWEEFPNGDIPKAIYASADGRNWTSHPIGGTWVSSISSAEGLLYAVGTAPGADRETVTMQIGISSDQGGSFETSPLPLGQDLPASFSANVMATPGGVVALGSATNANDPWAMIPPEELEGDVEAFETEAGIAVFPFTVSERAHETCSTDAAACEELIEAEATYFATWDELSRAAGDGPADGKFAFWSEGGPEFSPIEYPFPEGWIENTFTVGEEVVTSISAQGGSRLFSSRDGREWQELQVGNGFGHVAAIGETGGEVVVLGSTADFASLAAYRSPDLSGPWEEIPVGDLFGEGAEMWVSGAAVGEGGAAVSVGVAISRESTNPISGLLDRFFGGSDGMAQPGADGELELREEMAAGGEGEEMQILNALLISSDLTEWSLVPMPEEGGTPDTVAFTPDGDLVVHTTASANGRPTRIQATASP